MAGIDGHPYLFIRRTIKADQLSAGYRAQAVRKLFRHPVHDIEAGIARRCPAYGGDKSKTYRVALVVDKGLQRLGWKLQPGLADLVPNFREDLLVLGIVYRCLEFNCDDGHAGCRSGFNILDGGDFLQRMLQGFSYQGFNTLCRGARHLGDDQRETIGNARILQAGQGNQGRQTTHQDDDDGQYQQLPVAQKGTCPGWFGHWDSPCQSLAVVVTRWPGTNLCRPALTTRSPASSVPFT